VKRLLSPSGRLALRRFASGRTLLAFDFDGVLAPIVASPRDAGLRRVTYRRLQVVAGLYPCVVLTGRAAGDVRNKLRGVPLRRVIGNHGAELAPTAQDLKEQVATWSGPLERALARRPGIWVENKGLSLTVHYRAAPRAAQARRAILHAARALEQVRITGGKRVVNLLCRDAPHKGAALLQELERLRCDRAIFVGDDETDEDVFALGPSRVLAVRVGHRHASRAEYYLRDQREVDELLRHLEAYRPASCT
jgi:trehalose 6-phosphate phosphatase